MSPNVIAYIIIIYLNKNVYVFRCLLGHARLRFLLPISTIENAIMMMNIWRNHLTLHLQHLIHDALRTTKTLYRTHSKCGWNEIEIVGGFQSADLCATFTSNRSDKKQAIDCLHPSTSADQTERVSRLYYSNPEITSRLCRTIREWILLTKGIPRIVH